MYIIIMTNILIFSALFIILVIAIRAFQTKRFKDKKTK